MSDQNKSLTQPCDKYRSCSENRFHLGVDLKKCDYIVALAGNPNTGKSTIFNALTGLRQHTGNWPGKTVTRAEGGFRYEDKRYKLIDLPGTYSLLSTSVDEEIARDFILFGRTDCTIVIVDATCLERNLNLVLQVLEITDKVIIALNLFDEAQRKGIVIDHRQLSRDLGVPVIPTVARTKEGLHDLLAAISEIVHGCIKTTPYRIKHMGPLQNSLDEISAMIKEVYPDLPNAGWVAMRILEGDQRMREALVGGTLADLTDAGDKCMNQPTNNSNANNIIARADQFRRIFQASFHEEIVKTVYADAERISQAAIRQKGKRYGNFDQTVDRFLTSPITGLPVMALILAVIFWVTIVGANYPSRIILNFLFRIEELASAMFSSLGAPWWLTGFIWHGVYRGLAWVVAVMLPPMAIFFPLFTIFEDLGFLPRVAFNMDRLFKKCGAHGKQALTMSMGFGCNAAAIVATRIIDSPRERLIAILTNNFVPCNGRFPTLIMLATVFVGANFSPAFASIAAAGSIMAIVLLGIIVTLIVSAILSRTILKGEPSSFTLELPPYRRPSIIRILYTSFIDRTLFILYRAVVMAVPAGGIIWILSNIQVSGQSLTAWISATLNPFGHAIGLDGVILLAYIIAIPANEIVVPAILMAYANADRMFEFETTNELQALLVGQEGWTLLTAVCLMLFSLLHNPCSTTIWTMWKETRSIKWTTLGALMPLAIAFLVTFLVAQGARLLGLA